MREYVAGSLSNACIVIVCCRIHGCSCGRAAYTRGATMHLLSLPRLIKSPRAPSLFGVQTVLMMTFIECIYVLCARLEVTGHWQYGTAAG